MCIRDRSKPDTNPKETKSKLPAYIPRNISNKLAHFDEKYLYIGLISHSGCSIILHACSIPNRDHVNKKKLENQKLLMQQKFNQMGSFNEQMDENGGYYTEMLEMERRRKE